MTSKMDEKLKSKDLITIAIFSLLFTVCVLVSGVVTGISPIMYAFLVGLAAIPGGIVYMYLRVKVPKRGAIFIQSIILAIILFLVGIFWTIPLGVIAGGILAEIVSGIGKYHSFKWSLLGYIIFCVCMNIGDFIPAVFLKDYYLSYSIANGTTASYMEELINLITGPMLIVSIVATIVAAALGGWLGKKMLAKHFLKAGIA